MNEDDFEEFSDIKQILRFIDNANFLNASLHSLVNNLSKRLIIQKK